MPADSRSIGNVDSLQCAPTPDKESTPESPYFSQFTFRNIWVSLNRQTEDHCGDGARLSAAARTLFIREIHTFGGAMRRWRRRQLWFGVTVFVFSPFVSPLCHFLPSDCSAGPHDEQLV